MQLGVIIGGEERDRAHLTALLRSISETRASGAELPDGNAQPVSFVFYSEAESLDSQIRNLSRSSPLVVITGTGLSAAAQRDILTAGAHELVSGEELTAQHLSRAISGARARFRSFEEDRNREKMFNRLCDTLPFQMAYRIVAPPGEKARFVYVSDGVRHISGLSREQVLKEPDVLYNQIIEEDRARLEAAENEAVETLRPLEIEVQKRDVSGNVRWVHIRSFPEKRSDGAVIWDGIETNITSYKNSEEAVTKLLRSNQLLLESEREARMESERNSRMKDEFLATLSHELRTPINSVLGWVQLIRRGRLSAEQSKKAIDTVERNARAQAQLIADLLDMNRIISGKVELETDKTDVRQLILAAIESIRPAAEAKEIFVGFLMEPELDLWVSVDGQKIQQVLWNLLSNAVKFTPNNGTVTLKVLKDGGRAVLSVTDTGIGIKSEFLPYVFDRFRQADGGFSRKFGGLGLGLSIARHITELHDGTISVTSEGENKGTTFTLTLPLAEMESVPFGGDMHSAPEKPRGDLLGKFRILLVDDEIDALELAVHLLTDEGAEVIKAQSAGAALEILKKRRDYFDLIVSDIGMPDKDGFEFIREAGPLMRGREIPAIALTAFARAEDRARVLSAGYDAHLPKPVDPEELVSTAASLIAGRKTARAANL